MQYPDVAYKSVTESSEPVTHATLVTAAAQWLRRRGFGVIATEISSRGSQERPDAIGFRENCSAIVEAKISGSDFRADWAKKSRLRSAGLGTYRFYLTLPGVVGQEAIPAGWGLLYYAGGRVLEIAAPFGNAWPAYGSGSDDWRKFQHIADGTGERSVLFSIARRASKQT